MTTTETQTRATAAEDRLRRHLRDALMVQIEGRRLAPEDLADLTGMLPSGARALMSRKDWSLRTCLRVAESLGYRIDASVEPKT